MCFKEFVEVTLVGKTQLIAYLFNAVRAILQLVFYEMELIPAHIVPEGHACLLFEKDTKVVPGVAKLYGQVFQVRMFGGVDMAVQIIDNGADLFCMLGPGSDAAAGIVPGALKGCLHISPDEGQQGLDEEEDRFVGSAHRLFPFFCYEPDQLVGFPGFRTSSQEGAMPAMGLHEKGWKVQVDVGEFKEGKFRLFRYFKMMDVAGCQEKKTLTGIGIMVA